MKGFAMRSAGEVGWIQKDRPDCGDFEAILRPLAIAPGTADVRTVYANAIGERKDMILGYEAVAEIVEVGCQVHDFEVGDRVVVPSVTPHWRTEAAAIGQPQHSGGMLAGWKFSNYKDGVFSEYFHVNDADMNLAKLPDGIALSSAVMLSNVVTAGLQGAEQARIEFGERVVVISVGCMGLMAVAGAQAKGAARIVAIGDDEESLESAKFYGATDCIDVRREPDYVKEVLLRFGGHGADKVIIACSGEQVLKNAIRMLRPGGIVSNINYFAKEDPICIPRIEWGCGLSGKTIVGNLCAGGRVRMERLVRMVKYGKLDPSRLVTEELYGFDKIEQAFAMVRDNPQKRIKPVVIVS